MERKVRLLTTEGNGFYKEVEWVKPEIQPYEIEVKALMTGVCRSDIDMMYGQFNLPMNMHGHEGLGVVTQVGGQVRDVVVGDFVATRGEPAYADFYNTPIESYVKVPQPSPKYIVEPIACGINVFREIMLRADIFNGQRIAIIGTGFLSHVVCTNLNLRGVYSGIDVIGNYSKEFWMEEHSIEVQSKPDGKYDVVIDLSTNDISLTQDIYNPNALLVFASSKHPYVSSNFDHLLWNAVTMVCPSPRTPGFHACMLEAVSQIETGKLNVENFWTRGYNRNTEEWRLAFIDSANRPKGFNRAFIYW
jgi:D-arabinose 1-dehydrogenase-like Zn-dependent alcohol dehydrogenase